MTVADEKLAATHAAAFTGSQRAWTAQEFSTLRQTRGVILCGDAKSFILGRVVLDEAEILTVATHPTFWRQGRAVTCLRAFLSRAEAAGAKRAFLEVAADNDAAKQLYKKEIFSEIAKRANYYTNSTGQKIDAVIMERRLDRHPLGIHD